MLYKSVSVYCGANVTKIKCFHPCLVFFFGYLRNIYWLQFTDAKIKDALPDWIYYCTVTGW